MTITASIVTYNNEDTLENAIKSVMEYTGTSDFRLFLIDNGSEDGTLSIEERYEKIYPNITLIKNGENIGFGAGHNKVLNLVDSDYHVIINPDIELKSDVIHKICAYMNQNEDVVQVMPRVLNVSGTEQLLPKYGPTVRYCIISKFPGFRWLRRKYTRADEVFTKPTLVEFCSGCFNVVRTTVFKEEGGFDEKYFLYCEDADLSNKLMGHGKLIFYTDACVTHVWKRDNMGKAKFVFMKSLMYYFKKWGFKF